MAIFRVAYFAFDRLQEPLSRSIEVLARQSPTFNRGCATLARNFEKWRVSSLNRDLAVGEKRLLEARLTQEEAVHKGAALLGESILWITGSAVVLHQYLREKEDENEVAAAEQERLDQQEARIYAAIYASEARITARISNLEARLLAQDATPPSQGWSIW
jgi:hypothetical protein